MENKKIIYLYEIMISAHDRNKMGDEEFAFLSTLAFSVDEIGIFQKILIQTTGSKPKDDVLLSAYQIQQNVIMRVLSSKIFEATEILKNYNKIIRRRKGSAHPALCIVQEFCRELEEIQNNESYFFAKVIRDEATNHYKPSITKENLKEYGEGRRSFAYLHKNNGNSFYPFGEEAVFLARISRYIREKHNRDILQSDLEKWMNWLIETSRWLTTVQDRYFIWLTEERFPDWGRRRLTPYLEEEFFAYLGEGSLPVFYGVSEADL